MAEITVLVWRIDTNYTSPTGANWNTNLGPVTLTAGNHIHVIVDDVAFTLHADYRSSSTPGGGSFMGRLTEGPNLFFGYDGAATLLTVSPYWQACDGTALRRVGTSSLYPYGSLSYNPGAAECVIAPTCDLLISPFYTYEDASAPGVADGELRVFSSSSNDPVKYSFDPGFDYATEGQTSGTFPGLIAGVYTVYAKDLIGCQHNITIEIKVTTVYNVKYRLEFNDTLVESGKLHRIDILERSYVGAITEFCSGGDPLHVKWNGDANDPSLALVPSELVLQVQREAQGQFDDLFTDDDRKFKVNHYVSDMGLELDFELDTEFDSVLILYWTGYVVPEFHNEPWIHEPYDLTITATDQLGEFKNFDFFDEDGNKFKGDQKAIKLIAAVLKKADLALNIRCGLNIYSVEMTAAASDDPLDQAYIDTRIFLNEDDEPIKCDDVIKKILEPFRATLCQSNGVWWIRRISDMIGEFAYREFDPEGDYASNSTYDPVRGLKFPSEINRAAWANKSAFLSHLRNYGYFSVTHDAGRDNNLIDEGRFEFDDIEELGSGNQFFKNWNFFIGQPGVTFGFENVIRGNSKGAFFADFENANNQQNYSKLYSIDVPFSNGQGLVKIMFDHLVESRFAGLSYIALGWSVKVTNGTSTDWMKSDFPPEFSRGNDTDEIINEIYITSFNSWSTFQLTSSLLAVAAPATLTVTFYMHNHYGRDFANEAALRAFSISDLDDPLRIGMKRMVAIGSLTYVYESVADAISADSFPDIVHPDDYANDYLWQLVKVLNISPTVGLVKKFLIDNVSVSYFPNAIVNGRNTYIEPPATVLYSQEVSKLIKSNLNRTVFLGDMPRFNDEYEDNERFIYRGYFRMEDGSPTTLWTRTGIVEEKKLLTITMEDYRDQFGAPQRKLSGTFFSDIIWHYIFSVAEDFEGSRYQFLVFDFDAKKAQYTIDMTALNTGEDGEPPVENGAYSNAYSDSYDHI